MSEAQTRPRAHRFTLNTDGKRHPWLNLATAYTCVAGLVSLVLGLITNSHLVGTTLGVSGFIIGLWVQMMSATRAERIFIVFGITASFVGMGLGFAHGGFISG